MDSTLGAIKGGLDRPKERDDAFLTSSTNGTVPGDTIQLQQASTTSIPIPQTTAPSDGLAQLDTPFSAAAPLVDPASTPPLTTPSQSLATRKSPRLSRGPSHGAVKDPDSIRPPPAPGTSVQSSGASVAASSIDPLSQHILLRTNTDTSKNTKVRAHPSGPDSPIPDAASPISDSPIRFSSPIADVGKEKRKGFLGRLSMRTSKKKEDANDYASESGDLRTDGSNAHVFSSIVDSAGYIPHHKEPPRYIRVKLHNKKVKEFNRMFLAQELIGTRPPESQTDDRLPIVTVTTSGQGRKKTATGGAIWTTEFSKDGKYLAAGGRDRVVRVWQVISTAEDRRAQEEEEAREGAGEGERLSAPVFLEKPVHEFKGHTGEILDLSWSKNNFLLSTSMDKTVRLWHISREECLCTFKHKELVSKVAFHPTDDRFFLAGCLDTTLRLWSIPDKNIAYSAQLSDMITAVAFSPDGRKAIAGLLNGFCYLLETEGLKPLTQIHVRSSRGRNAKGSKITGIVSMVLPNSRPPESVIVVTSTDARVRVYNLRDKTLDCKFKGHEHANGQLTASYSDDGKYVICGSESRKVFIWSSSPSDGITKDRYPCETFDAHKETVTTAIFCPTKTRQLLGASGDPIYDLCNPPPITLMSLEETLASQSGRSNNTLHNDDPSQPTQASPPAQQQHTRAKPEESPAYIARSTHFDGNIIVTSDDTGVIKVFRQDCAASKRRHESWETGSSFGRKLGANSGLVGRSGSIITRTSASSAAHSRRGSITQPPSHLSSSASTPQVGMGRNSSDRINSWRHGVEGGSSRPSSLVANSIAPVRTERSISPTKSFRTPVGGPGGLASDARKLPYAATTSSPLSPHFGNQSKASMAMSPSSSTFSSFQQGDNPNTAASTASAASTATPIGANHEGPGGESTDSKGTSSSGQVQDESETLHPSEAGPSMTYYASGDETLRLDPAGASYGFWNLSRWKNIANLRPSFISGTGSSSGHTPETSASADSASPSATNQHSESHGDKNENTKPTHARRSFVNMLPKSPLSKSEAVDGESEAEGASSGQQAQAQARHGRPERHTRQRSGGLLSYLTPTITLSDESGQDVSHIQAASRSHSPYARSGSIISQLSSEMTSTDGDNEGGLSEGEGDEMRCTKCGGREFKGRRISGTQRMQCSRCGKIVDNE